MTTRYKPATRSEILFMTLDTREQLIHDLTEASELEHSILCSYLYAAFSLKSGVDEGLSPVEAEAVARWRRLLLQVALEEMGHLATVNNLLVAVGGAAHFDRPNLPVAHGYLPAEFAVRLTPFNEETLDHFIFLEHPDVAEVEDSARFRTVARSPRGTEPLRRTPSSEDYNTIAGLYARIREGVTALSLRRGSDAFSEGSHARQIGPEVVDLPGISVVTDLPSALRAIDIIVEQGEGASGDHDDSHFARFNAIKSDWINLKKSNSIFAPAHACAINPVMRRPADPRDRVWITAPEAVRFLDLGNALYGQVLVLLEEAYAPSTQATQKTAYVTAAMSLMQATSLIGRKLARAPATPDSDQPTAGLTFAMPRNLGARGRHTASHVLERLDELQDPFVNTEVGKAKASLSKALRRGDRG